MSYSKANNIASGLVINTDILGLLQLQTVINDIIKTNLIPWLNTSQIYIWDINVHPYKNLCNYIFWCESIVNRNSSIKKAKASNNSLNIIESTLFYEVTNAYDLAYNILTKWLSLNVEKEVNSNNFPIFLLEEELLQQIDEYAEFINLVIYDISKAISKTTIAFNKTKEIVNEFETCYSSSNLNIEQCHINYLNFVYKHDLQLLSQYEKYIWYNKKFTFKKEILFFEEIFFVLFGTKPHRTIYFIPQNEFYRKSKLTSGLYFVNNKCYEVVKNVKTEIFLEINEFKKEGINEFTSQVSNILLEEYKLINRSYESLFDFTNYALNRKQNLYDKEKAINFISMLTASVKIRKMNWDEHSTQYNYIPLLNFVLRINNAVDLDNKIESKKINLLWQSTHYKNFCLINDFLLNEAGFEGNYEIELQEYKKELLKYVKEKNLVSLYKSILWIIKFIKNKKQTSISKDYVDKHIELAKILKISLSIEI